MNCSVGQAVPDTSDVTVITDEVSCAVIAAPVMVACSNVEDEATDITLDGAVVTPARSDPHAIKGRTLMDTAPIENAALRNVTTNSSGKRRSVAAGVEALFHVSCRSSAVCTDPVTHLFAWR